ncbi:MAG: SpoIIE family protein phosphatase [Rhodothermaceae bacterium]|nr:SpoIIE family protein phosphatase [Rhodothermaceae bacterium]
MLIIGSAGFLFFLYAYPSENPDSAASNRVSSKEAAEIANTYLNEIGYTSLGDEASIRFYRDNSISTQLQHQMGRRSFNRHYESDIMNALPVMYWTVQQDNIRNLIIRGSASEVNWDVNLGVRVGAGGRVVRFSTDKPDSLAHIFNPGIFDELPLGSVYNDAGLQGLTPDQITSRLRFDLSMHGELPDSGINSLHANDTLASGGILNRDHLLKLADFHLGKTGWDPDLFRTDTMQVISGRSNTQARVRYVSVEPVHDHTIRLTLDLSVTGQLLNLNYAVNPLNPREKFGGEELWAGLSGIGFVITGIIAIIVFFRRFTLRLIDSKSALPDTLLGAFVLSCVVMVSAFNDVTSFGVADFKVIIGMLIGTFFMAALGGVLFFILASTSVSISYGVMPEKIRSLNLARSGYLFNTPVGIAIMQGLFASGIILGLYALYLSAFPHDVYYYEDNNPFETYFLFGQTISNLVAAILIAIYTAYSLYLILGAMVYGEKQRLVLFLITTIVVWTLAFPLNPGLANPWLSIISAAVTGAVVAMIYLRYDALTVVASLFFASLIIPTYTIFLTHPPHWITEFSLSTLIIAGWVAIGIVGIHSLKSGDELPGFVPAYIYEHANRQRIERELEIARQVQLSFLPERTPYFPSLDMAANCRAASEVGGDYYDFIHLDDHRMAVVIGDVSGKGIQAAFFMTLVKGFIQSLSRVTHEPALFLSKLNFLFCKNVNKGTFVSLIFGVIDTQNHTFTFARAGHNPIIYSTASNGKPVLLNTSGLAIGMVADSRFEDNIEVHTINLKAQDTLVLYTDGYSEAMDPSKNLYGEDKLMAVIHKHNTVHAADLLDAINRDVNKYQRSDTAHAVQESLQEAGLN